MADQSGRVLSWRVSSRWCQTEAVVQGDPRLNDVMPPHDCSASPASVCRITTISGPIKGADDG